MKDYPIDWNDDSVYRGLTKNEPQRQYDVKFAILGRQRYIGSTTTKLEAAKLYDLTLWKLLPKMTRRAKPNFPLDFEFFTQQNVADKCPKLNELFKELPFNSFSDSLLPEDLLRQRRLIENSAPLPSGRGEFEKAVYFLKRLQIDTEVRRLQSTTRRNALTSVNKFPSLSHDWTEVDSALTHLMATLIQAEISMEGSREYYAKLASHE